LLSQHLVNWSMGSRAKQTSIKLGIAYGSDVAKTKKIFADILEANDNVAKNPAPQVVAKNFGPYSIDFELSFWVAHVSEFDKVRNAVITAIDIECRKGGIVIPIPRQDISIRSVPADGKSGQAKSTNV